MSTTAEAPKKTSSRRLPKVDLPPWTEKALVPIFFVIAWILPYGWPSGAPFLQDCVQALAYVVMALGLNIVVGFAGLLDLGYVAFYAIGAYCVGWFGSGFYADSDVHVGATKFAENLAGIHLSWFLIAIIAMVLCAGAGIIIGLPTLRLRGDYIAIVTLAFGEIIGRIAVNGDEIKLAKVPLLGGLFKSAFGPDQTFTAGRQGITPVDKIDVPFVDPFTSLNLRPWYYVALFLVLLVLFVNFRLRDSRLGRAWIALREDEVAAVGGHLADDLAERERHDRDVVAAQAQRGHADQRAGGRRRGGDLRRGGRDHRHADAAAARRLHRDRDARLRRDHR